MLTKSAIVPRESDISRRDAELRAENERDGLRESVRILRGDGGKVKTEAKTKLEEK